MTTKKKTPKKKAPARKAAEKTIIVKTERKNIPEDRLLTMMNHPLDHPIFQGVFEIIDDLNESIDRAHCDISVPREARGDAMLQKAMCIEIKERIMSCQAMAKARVSK